MTLYRKKKQKKKHDQQQHFKKMSFPVSHDEENHLLAL